MNSIISSVQPTDTYLNSLRNYFASLQDKAVSKLDEVLNRGTGWMAYNDGVVLGSDVTNAINNGLESVNVISSDGSISTVSIEDVTTYLGDNLVTADIAKEFVASISSDAADRINEGSAAFRSVVSSKYGTLSARASGYMESLCSILESGGSKISKVLQFFNFHKPKGSQDGFKTFSDSEEYTGINPWVSFFCGPLPDFSSIGRALLQYWGAGWKMVGKFYSAIGEGFASMFSGTVNWFQLQSNPHDLIPIDGAQDYSLDAGYWYQRIPLSYKTNEYYIRVRDYINQHGRNFLCIPTLGCTIYIGTDSVASVPDEDISIIVYVKKHLYDYNKAHEIKRIASLGSNTVQTFDAACSTIGDMRPSVITDSSTNENYLFNGLLQAEALIPLGVALISCNSNIIEETLSRYGDGTISTFQFWYDSSLYNPSNYYSAAVTNVAWKNEYIYGSVTTQYLVNTLFNYIRQGIISEENNSFFPYNWTTGQLTGIASIKTDGMNLAEVQSLVRKIGITTAIVIGTVVVAKGLIKLRTSAIDAQRAADLATFDPSVSNTECRKKGFKAWLLAKASGLSTNAAVSSAPKLVNAFTSSRAVATSETNVNRAINELKALIR